MAQKIYRIPVSDPAQIFEGDYLVVYSSQSDYTANIPSFGGIFEVVTTSRRGVWAIRYKDPYTADGAANFSNFDYVFKIPSASYSHIGKAGPWA